MSTIFDALPIETRRGLARAELRKRGLHTERDDMALQDAFAALRAGVATLPGYVRFNDSVLDLSDRIEARTVTADDAAMLGNMPDCSLSAVELVQLFAEIERAY